jgi:hypothetical protein
MQSVVPEVVAQMPLTPAQVAAVTPERRISNRISYKIELCCGCQFWEHRDDHEAPPIIGGWAQCAADHTRRVRRTAIGA